MHIIELGWDSAIITNSIGQDSWETESPLRGGIWQVWVDNGFQKTNSYDFASFESADADFNSRWCARILVDPTYKETRSSSGINWFGLQRVRAEWQASLARLPPYDVFVCNLSGESVEIQLHRSATVGDVKASATRLWGTEPSDLWVIDLSLDERVVTDDEPLSTLDVGLRGHFTFTSTRRFIALEQYDELLEEIRKERTKPAMAGNSKLTNLLDQRDALRQELVRHGYEEDDHGYMCCEE